MIAGQKLFVSSLALMGASILLMLCFQVVNLRSESDELRLAGLIGRIQQHETLMSTSLQLAIYTRIPTYRQSYRSAGALYEQGMQEALKRIPPDKARDQLIRSYYSHQALSHQESAAFELMAARRYAQAEALIDSPAYQRRSLASRLALEDFLFEFQSLQHRQNKLIRNALLGVGLLLALSSMLLVSFWRRNQDVRMRLMLTETRMQTMQVTIRTAMDVVNNNLNRMRLMQLRWKKKPQLESGDLQALGELIQETSASLKAIGDLEAYETSGQGPTELLRWKQT